MNIQFNNWQLINLSGLQTALTNGSSQFDAELNSFDVFADLNPEIETNTRLKGTTDFGSVFNYDVIGNNFLSDAPFYTITSANFTRVTTGSTTIVTGSLTEFFDDFGDSSYSGFFNKVSYTSGSTTFLIEGRISVDTAGDPAGGT